MLCTEENRRYRFVGNTKNGGDHCAERGKENTTKSEAKDMKGGGGGGNEVGRGGKATEKEGQGNGTVRTTGMGNTIPAYSQVDCIPLHSNVIPYTNGIYDVHDMFPHPLPGFSGWWDCMIDIYQYIAIPCRLSCSQSHPHNCPLQ